LLRKTYTSKPRNDGLKKRTRHRWRQISPGHGTAAVAAPSVLTTFLALVVLIALSVGLCFAQADPTPAIAQALQTRDFAQALELLQPALRQFPANAELWAMKGTAYVGLDHKKEALNSFQTALTFSPDYIVALQGAAQIEFDAASPSAIPLLQHLLRLRPGDPTGHGMLAVLEYQQGNCESAVRHFERASSLFDDRPRALHGYATCLVQLRQFDRAAKVFQRTLALNPDDARERRLLASIQLMAHQPQDALATLQPLLQANSQGADTLELAATAYEGANDTPQAVATLRQAILLDPRNVNLYLDFANLSSAHDSSQVGIDLLSDGVAQLPQAAPLYLARGVLYVQLAQYDQAETDFETAYRLDPNQSLSSAAQGVLAVQQDDIDRALKTVQTRLVRKPADPLLLYLQADFLSQKGAEPGTPQFRLAMRSAKQAVSLQPGLSSARTVLAKLYLQAGNPQQAVDQCRKALDRDPHDQTALYRLIQGLRKTGNASEIPDLLKQLASLRKESAKEQSARYQYKLVEEDSSR
jgi:tetratricopeptide (TPR) repeat protein